MEELVRWRLFNRTGGGLMAELGSHQLDACSIFLGKVHPLAVTGIGGKHFYRDDREVEDHVYCTFEFPDKDYYADASRTTVKDPNDIVVVTYSSISTNAFEPYGECVKGSRASMIVESEQTVLLYPEKGAVSKSTSVSVTDAKKPATVVDASATSGPAERKAVETGSAAAGSPVSRGYREEMEDFAYCIKMWEQGATEDKDRPKDAKGRPIPRCHGRVAMADAIIALTANLAMRGTPASGGNRSASSSRRSGSTRRRVRSRMGICGVKKCRRQSRGGMLSRPVHEGLQFMDSRAAKAWHTPRSYPFFFFFPSTTTTSVATSLPSLVSFLTMTRLPASRSSNLPSFTPSCALDQELGLIGDGYGQRGGIGVLLLARLEREGLRRAVDLFDHAGGALLGRFLVSLLVGVAGARQRHEPEGYHQREHSTEHLHRHLSLVLTGMLGRDFTSGLGLCTPLKRLNRVARRWFRGYTEKRGWSQ